MAATRRSPGTCGRTAAKMAHREWRVAVTRDEDHHGPLSAALQHEGFEPVWCVVMEQLPSEHPAALEIAAASLDTFDWVVCSSVRAVAALATAQKDG